jgi:hypothetical protein
MGVHSSSKALERNWVTRTSYACNLHLLEGPRAGEGLDVACINAHQIFEQKGADSGPTALTLAAKLMISVLMR